MPTLQNLGAETPRSTGAKSGELKSFSIILIGTLRIIVTLFLALAWTVMTHAQQEQPPKPVKGDPEGGIDVAGGKVHRGTGTYVNPENKDDKRAAFYLWIVPDKDTKCKDYEWYQFVKAEAKAIDNGTEKDVTKDLGKSAITSAIGSDITFGKWSGDYHKKEENDRNKEREKKHLPKLPHEKMPGSHNGVDAGPYSPRPIPGTGGTEGLIDAPSWGHTGGWEHLVKRLKDAGILPVKKTGDKAPPDGSFTLVVTEHFKDYLFCIDPTPTKCLGYSEETYTETMKFKVTWAASSSPSLGGPSNQEWDASVTLIGSDSKVTFGAWKACP